MLRLRSAFSLIEILIAVSLGLAICFIAFSGMRMASQAVAVANRLSTQNQMLRVGVEAALEELDTWNSYNDSAAPTTGALASAGNPFAPSQLSALDWGGRTSLTDHDQSRPHSWWRGKSIEQDERPYKGSLNWGNPCHQYLGYMISEGTLTRTTGDIGLVSSINDNSADAQEQSDRRWYGHSLQDIADQLGYYALIDYAPANCIYQYYATAADGHAYVPDEFCVGRPNPWGAHKLMDSQTFPNSGPRDIAWLTNGTAFAVTTNPAMLADDVNHRFFWFWEEPFSQIKAYGWLILYANDRPDNYHVRVMWNDERASTLPGCARHLPLIDVYPVHWPRLAVQVRHFVISCRQFNTASVETTDPLSGQSYRLFISDSSTTLRGARRQRGLDHE